jgi:hypothetical protein
MQGEDGAAPCAASATDAVATDNEPVLELGNESFPWWHSVPGERRPPRHAVRGTEHRAACGVEGAAPRAAAEVEPTIDRDLGTIRATVVALLRDADQMARMHRAAEIAARVPRGSLVAQEIVADVVADTYEGVLTWNPERKLALRLMDEVRRRANRMRRNAEKHIPLAELPEASTPLVDSEGADVEPDVAQLRERAARVREQIGDDPVTLQLLTLYELGIRRKRDVLMLGMRPQAYRRARDRLLGLFGAESIGS